MDSKLKCVFDYVEDGEAKHVETVGANVSAVITVPFNNNANSAHVKFSLASII